MKQIETRTWREAYTECMEKVYADIIGKVGSGVQMPVTRAMINWTLRGYIYDRSSI